MNVESQISELNQLKKQMLWWRVGATSALALIAIYSVTTLRNSVQGLVQPGPAQEQFVSTLSDGLKRDVLPSLQLTANRTLTDLKPEIQKSFTKLNQRVPELATAAMKEVSTLQATLPEAGEKAFTGSFENMLKSREAKIHELYPNVTEDQVKSLVDNLSHSGKAQIFAANDLLFAEHQATLKSVMKSMEQIREQEAGKVANTEPSWEMGLAVLDVLRDDLKSLAPKKSNNPKTVAEKASTKAGKKA